MSELRKRAFNAPGHASPRAYSVAQWNHGRGGKAGGLEIPTRHFQGAAALALPAPVEVAHSEASEEAWLLPAFHLALAGWKPARWERRCGQIVEAAPPDLAEPWKAGYRSRRQVIGVVKELWEVGYQGFVVLSVRATASQDLARALGQAARLRLAAGQSAAGTAFPEYAFWIPLAAGKPERIVSQDGQSSFVIPIVAALPEKPTDDDFAALLIPEDVQAFIEAHLDEVAQWEAGATNGASLPAASLPAPEGEPAGEETAPEEATLEETVQEAAPAAGRPAPRRKAGYPEPVDYLRMIVPFGTKQHPEFRGKPLGDLLSTLEGRQFVNYLAYRHKPANEAQDALCRGARALAAAGLVPLN